MGRSIRDVEGKKGDKMMKTLIEVVVELINNTVDSNKKIEEIASNYALSKSKKADDIEANLYDLFYQKVDFDFDEALEIAVNKFKKSVSV